MKVFISSTYEDLRLYREVLMDTLQKMGDHLQFVAMEHFGADPRSPYKLCQEKVTECDLYIGIFGWRYGSMEPTSHLSMTEMEYRTALARGIPIYLYCLSEDQPVPPTAIGIGTGASKLRKLKREIAGRHVFQTFKTPEDLSRLVAVDLARHLRSGMRSQEIVNPTGPVEPETIMGHPYVLCHILHSRGPIIQLPPPEDSYYRVHLYIDLYENDVEERRRLLQAIDRVVYQLHKSFMIPVVPMQNWEDYFVYSLIAYGEFWVRATVYFKDDGTRPVQLTRYINLLFPSEFYPDSEDNPQPADRADG